ncbi:hypothetical protein PM082_012330 [Marasmius tenuissimus]|nr:hypothetical protein PM082_012330 [Marasmius tenuissimus]
MTEDQSLEPLLASQRCHLCYLVVGSLTIVLWDIVTHLRVDLRLLRRTGIHLPQMIYILSRVTMICFLLCETVLLTAQVGSYCAILETAVTTLGSVHNTLKGLMHLLHVRAVYMNRPWVLRFFSLFWMLSSGTTIATSPFMLSGATIAGGSCMHIRFSATLQQLIFAISTVHGTCIVLAMSNSLVLSSPDFPITKNVGFIARVKTSITAKDLPTFSKSFLRHSQGYYLLLMSINLLTTIGISINAVPLAYRVGTLFVIYAVLHCASCSIFRNIGKARYVTQDFIDDLPISFYRSEPSPSSSRYGANSALQETPDERNTISKGASERLPGQGMD